MLRNTLRRNKGITLIALVVTIIVLLILAGISIAMLTGQNGILNRAAEAKEKTRVAQEDESQKLKGYEDTINQYAPSSNGGSLPTGTGTTPYLPNSTFSKKEGDLFTTGLVIQDANQNEYVWVEVPTTIYDNTTYNNNGAKKPSSADDWEKIRDCLKAYTVDYSNSSFKDTNTDGTTYSDDYKNMLKSVYTNGGFWIGRYEAGYEIDESKGETVRYYGADNGIEHPITQKVVIKKNAYPYNWVRRDQAQTLAEGMNYEGATSSLIYGVQWDLVLKFIETKSATTQKNLTSDSKAIGNYKDNLWNITNVNAKYSTNRGNTFNACPYPKTASAAVLLTTGADTSFSLMNIYDIAGNVWEWTREFHNTDYPCNFRGGSYYHNGSYYPAKSRGDNDTSYSATDVGFRLGLWR